MRIEETKEAEEAEYCHLLRKGLVFSMSLLTSLRQTSLQARAHSAPGSKWFDWTQSVFALISHDQLALLWFQTRQARVIGKLRLFGQQPSLTLEVKTTGSTTWRVLVGLARQQGRGQHLALRPEVALSHAILAREGNSPYPRATS